MKLSRTGRAPHSLDRAEAVQGRAGQGAVIQEAQFFRTEDRRRPAQGRSGWSGAPAARAGDGVFVGVLRSAKSSGGASLVNVAAIQEFGSRPIVLKITPKVRALLHAAFRKAGLDAPSGERPSTGVAVIRILPGPFLRPVFETYGAPDVVAKRFVDRVAKLLGGDFGH